MQDERFKTVDNERFEKKKKSKKNDSSTTNVPNSQKKKIDKRFQKTALPNKKAKKLLLVKKGAKKS